MLETVSYSRLKRKTTITPPEHLKNSVVERFDVGSHFSAASATTKMTDQYTEGDQPQKLPWVVPSSLRHVVAMKKRGRALNNVCLKVVQAKRGFRPRGTMANVDLHVHRCYSRCNADLPCCRGYRAFKACQVDTGCHSRHGARKLSPHAQSCS